MRTLLLTALERRHQAPASTSVTPLKLIETFHQNLKITSNRSKIQPFHPTAGRICANTTAMMPTTIIIESIGDRRINTQLTPRLSETWTRTRMRHNKKNKNRERTHPTNETYFSVNNQASNNRGTPIQPPNPNLNSREGVISLLIAENNNHGARSHRLGALYSGTRSSRICTRNITILLYQYIGKALYFSPLKHRNQQK